MIFTVFWSPSLSIICWQIFQNMLQVSTIIHIKIHFSNFFSNSVKISCFKLMNWRKGILQLLWVLVKNRFLNPNWALTRFSNVTIIFRYRRCWCPLWFRFGQKELHCMENIRINVLFFIAQYDNTILLSLSIS